MPSRLLLLAAVIGVGAAGAIAMTMAFGREPPGAQIVEPKTPPTTEYRNLLGPAWRSVLGEDTWADVSANAPGEGGEAAEPVELEDIAGKFQGFPLYWVGPDFQGLPLSGVIRHASPPGVLQPEDFVTFSYGTCNPGDGGCGVPLSIRVEPYCYVQPELIADQAKEGPVQQFRDGADAQFIAGALVVWTGEVAITINGWSRDQIMAAAEALVSANGLDPTSVDDALPPPERDCADFRIEPHPALGR